ncbi:Las1-domain-containing protein [Rhizophagus clarus]|uniref:Las1-domain-containing protein n=1 Tax=Rhizophagus clarus TaxID=94130 RepID=A0A8H3M0W6_9GLOM|nr:Las1-domain-containing protein [Rhizophagus clarus]
MLKIPRIVPWTSLEEFQQVRQWLYSESPNQREIGVKRVKAWSSRGKVPHAVVSTAAFVEVSLRDEFRYENISNHELRLLYSMVFIRFVNGMVDPVQQGTFALSISSIAVKLNMPLWFVEVRHAGTHEHLPSLQILRNGCRQALQWLNENYWSSQKPLQSTQVNKIRSLILQHKELRKEDINGNNNRDSSRKIMGKIMELISEEYISESIIPVLLEPGFLVPMAKKKRALAQDLSLLPESKKIWDVMLQAFDKEWDTFGNELILKMLEVLNKDNDDIKSDMNNQEIQPAHTSSSYLITLAAWIKHILSTHYNGKSFTNLDVNNILEFCLRKPSTNTQLILQVMMECDEELKTSVSPFVNYIDKMLHSKDVIHNIEDIPKITEDDMNVELNKLRSELDKVNKLKKEEISVISENNHASSSNEDSSWKMYDYNEWKPCALGCLPNGQVPCLDLPLELDGPATNTL